MTYKVRCARFDRAAAAGLITSVFLIAAGCSTGETVKRGSGSGAGTSTGGDSASGGTLSLGGNGPGIGVGGSGGVMEPPAIECDAQTPCPDSLICVNKADGTGATCRTDLGPCASDADCSGDSFCCGEGCRTDGAAEGVCVPFSSDNPTTACGAKITIGVFSPALQCEWKGPAAGDPFPEYKRVLASAIVGELPNDSGAAAEIVIVASQTLAGADQKEKSAVGGVIRILNGQTCEQVEVIADSLGVRDPATPAIADLDGDGNMEIVTRTSAVGTEASNVVAFRWDGSKFVKWWTSSVAATTLNANNWDGVSIHDLDDDGKAEIVGRNGEVLSGLDGARLNPSQTGVVLVSEPAVGDVDGDGAIELVANKVFRWTNSAWAEAYPGVGVTTFDGSSPAFYAYADFGTKTGSGFDRATKDGVAEVVATGGGQVSVTTLDGFQVMQVTGLDRGGPPTIGDFDGDGEPEFASADGTALRVFDLGCEGAPSGCEGEYLLWSKAGQDQSSAQTGSTIFDFEADGKAEVVYADECFLRIYSGPTGEVYYSAYRTSCTWWELPIVADPDNDTRTEIIVNSNQNCYTKCPSGGNGPYLDPIDPGMRCDTDADCISQNCDEGFCRCADDLDCGNTFVFDPTEPMNKGGSVCATPLEGTPGSGNVCRMQHPNPDGAQRDTLLNGVKVYRDKLDRWAPSRNLWNQHAYSITNINDDGSIPRSSEWAPNFTTPGLNNFRQNRQGEGADYLPDITGKLEKSLACVLLTDQIELNAQVCNRGQRIVGADMPATFYLGDATPENILCVSYTQGPVPVGGCLEVQCLAATTSVPDGSTITMVVNDDGTGRGATTNECNLENNTDFVVIDACQPPK